MTSYNSKKSKTSKGKINWLELTSIYDIKTYYLWFFTKNFERILKFKLSNSNITTNSIRFHQLKKAFLLNSLPKHIYFTNYSKTTIINTLFKHFFSQKPTKFPLFDALSM